MRSLTIQRYVETSAKYKKLSSRYRKRIESGTFDQLTRIKQQKLISRLKKLYNKLMHLKHLLKTGIVGTATVLMFTGGDVQAQEFNALKPFMHKHALSGSNNAKSELFVQRRGAANPFGTKSMFDGEVIQSADYAIPVDLDNDGDLDIVNAGFDFSTYSYYIQYQRNDGDNVLSELTPVEGQNNPFDLSGLEYQPYLSFADIDNDGDKDAFYISGNSQNIQFLKNIGTPSSPSFELQQDASNPLSDIARLNTRHLSFADIDNDGDLDVFIGNTETNYLMVPTLYRNVGDAENPQFAAVSSDNFFQEPLPFFPDIYPEDLDDDGDYDAYLYQDYYLKNTGNASQPYFIIASDAENPFIEIDQLSDDFIHLTDIDDDGDMDLLFGKGTKMFHYENVGNPSSPVFQNWSKGPLNISYIVDPAFADIDDDGDLDVLFVDYADYYSNYGFIFKYFENIGDAENAQYIEKSGSNNPFDGFTLSSYIVSLEFADIDDDGDWDLFVGEQEYYSDTNIAFFQNIGTPSKPDIVMQNATGNPLSAVEVNYYAFIDLVDIDDDGDLDFFFGEYGGLQFYRNNGTSTNPNFVKESSPLVFPETWYLGIPAFADIDSDGDYDVMVSAYDPYSGYWWEVKYFKNIGTPSEPNLILQDPANNPLFLHSFIPILSFADIDSDSDEDAFVGVYGGDVYLYSNETIPSAVNNISGTQNVLKLHPNPASSEFTFTENIFEGEPDVSIYDINGKKINNVFILKRNQINVSGLSPGIYIVRIMDSVRSKTAKLIIQR